MDNILIYWQANEMEILFGLLVLLAVLALRAIFLLGEHKGRLGEMEVRLLERAQSQEALLKETRQEITGDLIKSQLMLRDHMHKSVAELVEKHVALEKRLLEDAGALKAALIGAQSELKDALSASFSQLERRTLEDLAGSRQALTQGFEGLQSHVAQGLANGQLAQQQGLAELRTVVEAALGAQRESFEKRQTEVLKAQHEALHSGMQLISKQLRDALSDFSDKSGKRLDKLTETTDSRLKEISSEVEKRLAKGFEKTTETFTKVLEHLSRIDEAQKKITELSGNVVSLQEVLADKRSRGAFGEVQLGALVRNMLPEDQFAVQAQLSNGNRVDCLLYLPQPTGNVPIDAKFPLESYQRMVDRDASKGERELAARQFRNDIRKHIKDISEKYLIPGETADGAIMFLPAEAVFAEIHAHFPELIEEAQKARVWVVSPTTLMAVLTTARAVIKDVATRKQVHIIQEHLGNLAKDFSRFQERMDLLARHIRMAHEDVEKVNTSARKISTRFERIERVELDDADLALDDSPSLIEKKVEETAPSAE